MYAAKLLSCRIDPPSFLAECRNGRQNPFRVLCYCIPAVYVSIHLYLLTYLFKSQRTNTVDAALQITRHFEARDFEAEMSQQWRTLAFIIDRLLFWISLLILLVVALWMIVISAQHPHTTRYTLTSNSNN